MGHQLSAGLHKRKTRGGNSLVVCRTRDLVHLRGRRAPVLIGGCFADLSKSKHSYTATDLGRARTFFSTSEAFVATIERGAPVSTVSELIHRQGVAAAAREDGGEGA